jgi:hypothetical protein
MSEPAAAAPAANTANTADTADAADAVRARLAGTNINERSLLATDYLNHFNELVMLLELIPDLPDCLEEARAWRPKGYREHFRDSAFSDRALAVEAYDASPPEYRAPFDETVSHMNALVAQALDGIGAALATGDADRVRLAAASASSRLRGKMDIVAAIVNGEKPTVSQAGIDALLNG